MSALRNPDVTRSKILAIAAEEMRLKGYQGTCLSDVIKKSGVSKGAVYHHFLNKQELGYAVFEEVYQKEYFQFWRDTLKQDNPVVAIMELVGECTKCMSPEEMRYGCPVNSISQEMASEDEGFRERTLAMHLKLQEEIAAALQRGKDNNQVKADVDVKSVAIFIVAGFQGMSSITKTARCKDMMKQVSDGFVVLLKGLLR